MSLQKFISNKKNKQLILFVIAVILVYFWWKNKTKITPTDYSKVDYPNARTDNSGDNGGGGGGNGNGGTTTPDPEPVVTYTPTLLSTSLPEYIDIRFVADGSGGWLLTDHATGYPLHSNHKFMYVVGNTNVETGTDRLTNYPWPSNMPFTITKEHFQEPRFPNYANTLSRSYDISPGINEIGAYQSFYFKPNE